MHTKLTRNTVTGLALASVMLAGGVSAQAAGFGLYEMSARGNAMGGALVGRTDDPSANYFNPAGLTDLPGTQLMGGLTWIVPQVTVKTQTPMGRISTDSERNNWLPPHLYGSFQLDDRTWLGLGVFSPFGLGSEFPKTWPGRYNSYEAIIQTVEANPNLAYKVTDKLSLAIGASAMNFDLTLKRMLPNPTGGSDLDFALEGDSVGFGVNAALKYDITSDLSVGFSYRSPVEQEVEGTARAKAGGRTLSSTDAEGDITLPAFYSLGVNYKPVDRLNIGVGAMMTGWSSYDELRVKFDRPVLGRISESVTEKDWNDVMRYFAGVEYGLTDALTVRVSYVYDEDPIPDRTADYIVPSDNRHIISLGLGYTIRDITIDVTYSQLLIEDRNNVAARLGEGVFPSDFVDGSASMVGVSVSSKF